MYRSPVVVADPLTHVDVDPPEELVPLSVLALDLAQPAEGWNIYLAGRGITVTVDDLGRTAIARGDARRLFVERRENEARGREKAAELVPSHPHRARWG